MRRDGPALSVCWPPARRFASGSVRVAESLAGSGSRGRRTTSATRRPSSRGHHEEEHPPRVHRDSRDLYLREHVRDAEHGEERVHPRRRLLQLPPVLHGQAEDPRHRWPRGPVRGPVRQEEVSSAPVVVGPPEFPRYRGRLALPAAYMPLEAPENLDTWE